MARTDHSDLISVCFTIVVKEHVCKMDEFSHEKYENESIRSISQSFMTEFIELYRSFPSVWKVKTKDYNDRHKKNKAYEALVKKWREVEPNADRETVVRKINNIRSSFRRELKKVMNSKSSADGSNDVYVPSLWYFHLLLFLVEEETSGLSKFSKSSTEYEETTDALGFPEEEPQSLDSVPSEEITKSPHLPIIESYRIGSSHESNHHNINFKKRKFKENSVDANLDVVLSLVKDKLDSQNSSRHFEDEYEAIGRNVAAKLRRIPNRSRIIAEKIIGEVLFRAEMNTLDINSKITIGHSLINPTAVEGYNEDCNNAGVPNQFDPNNRQEQIYVKEEPTDAILLHLTERS